MTDEQHAGLRLVSIVAALAGAMALLGLAGGRLPGPVLAVAHGPPVRWTGSAEPAGVVIGLVHAVAVAGVVYLLCAAVLELATLRWSGRVVGDHPRRARLPWASTAVRRAAGLGLAISVGSGAPFASPVGGATIGSAVVMHLEEPSPAPVMHLVSPPPAPRTVASPPTRRADPSAATGRSRSIRPAAVWTIRPGDHLWKVARLTLAETRGHPASDAAILAYVEAIVRANEEVFVAPGHPDLVYPGQRFVLPPLPVT